MKTVWTLAVFALASCSPQPTTAPAAPAAAAADPALAAISAMERPAASSAAERAGAHCANGEAVVFSCTIASETVSVCVSPTMVSYRDGPLGAPELEIASTGVDGRAHASDIVGAGGGRQSAVRFSNGGYEYIVHAMEAGQLTDAPGRAFAGVTVLRGDAAVSDLECPDPARRQFRTSDIPAQGETDERYEVWF